MSKINVLGFDVANLIAAGEVVDRPASVVKELIENSVDSGADEITVEIKNGGISHIRVSDNGCGMDPDDLPLAVLRHATSKIKYAKDLDSIYTLGFRGEALAAIAAVTKLKIYTRPHNDDMGSLMVCEGGQIVELTETGCSAGTTVIADELFYNVPARRKFLKRDATECAKITDIVEKVALSVPDISIKYICDGEIRFMTQGDGSLKNAVYSVYGKRIASRLIKVDRSENGVRVSGYVSEPDMTFSKRSQEVFFVNSRCIRSPLLTSALERAYLSRIPEDKFPMCVLNLSISPEAVDVNVHPTKLEVKFSNERIVSETLYYSVLTALTSTNSHPELSPRKITGDVDGIGNEKYVNRVINAFTPVEKENKEENRQIPIEYEKSPESASAKNTSSENNKDKRDVVIVSGGGFSASSLLAGYDIPDHKDISNEALKISLTDDRDKSASGVPSYRIIGEAYDCYVFIELKDRILIIDKHAAHERIIFEELCERRRNKTKETQKLLVPIELYIMQDEAVSLDDYAEDIKQIGFEFDYYKDSGRVMLTSIPSEIDASAASDTFCAILSRLSEGKGTVESTESEFFEKALYQAACKAAIKGGRHYGAEHIKWICDKLLQEPGEDGKVIKTCPHGRPVAFEIKLSSIDRQFLRTE